MHIVIKRLKSKSYPRGRNYFYAAESVRDEKGKVKQKLIKYLGTGEDILEKFGYKVDK